MDQASRGVRTGTDESSLQGNDPAGRGVAGLFPAGRSPVLAWGACSELNLAIDAILDASARRGKSKKAAADGEAAGSSPLTVLAEQWLSDASSSREPRATLGLESLAWAHRLVDLADSTPGPTAQRLREQLERIVTEVLGAEAAGTETAGDELADVDPRDQAWRQVELPLTWAAMWPNHQRRDEWARCAADQLNLAWAEWVDSEGMPRAALLPILPAVFASWTRSRHLWLAAPLPGWTDNHAERFDSLVAAILRLRRWNGTCPGSSLDGPTLDESLNAALSDGGRDELLGVAKAVGFPLRVSPRSPPRATVESPTGEPDGESACESARELEGPGALAEPTGAEASAPESPTDYSEFAQLATCRSHFGANGLHVVASFPGDTSSLEISLSKQLYLAGPWRFRFAVDGVERRLARDWHEVSWFTDEDADYLELGSELDDGSYVRRHMLLVRDARLLFAGDAVFSAAPGELAYEAEIPLGPDMRFEPEAESSEGTLIGPRGQARVLPLALPEWRAAGASPNGNGHLNSDGRSLQWSLWRSGQRLFAPLAISCDPRTIRSPFTWRQLTVAETRLKVTADIAVAFRVQIDKKQWFLYRSLNGFGNRTAMGQNVAGQFVAGEFLRTGLLRGLIETEMEA